MIASKLIERYTEMNQFGRLIELQITSLQEGYCMYSILVQQKHLATERVIHGGVLSAIMDQTMGVAALSQVEKMQKLVATLEFKITYFNPASINDTLTSTGEVIKAGNRIIYTEGVIKNQNNVLICKGTGTFNAYPAKKVGITL